MMLPPHTLLRSYTPYNAISILFQIGAITLSIFKYVLQSPTFGLDTPQYYMRDPVCSELLLLKPFDYCMFRFLYSNLGNTFTVRIGCPIYSMSTSTICHNQK